jgi:hypothetical protein
MCVVIFGVCDSVRLLYRVRQNDLPDLKLPPRRRCGPWWAGGGYVF